MASQVLSGSGNVTYTNNTGQNVRVVINFMSNLTSMSWAGVTHTNTNPNSSSTFIPVTIGRNLAFNTGVLGGGMGGAYSAISANNMMVANGSESFETSMPTELMLSAGQTFSAVLSSGVYNIVVIPEAG